jgi:hypothetical protein
VELAPQTEAGRAEYFTALEAADGGLLHSSVSLSSRDRLAEALTE